MYTAAESELEIFAITRFDPLLFQEPAHYALCAQRAYISNAEIPPYATHQIYSLHACAQCKCFSRNDFLNGSRFHVSYTCLRLFCMSEATLDFSENAAIGPSSVSLTGKNYLMEILKLKKL